MHAIRELIVNSKNRYRGTAEDFSINIPMIENLRKFRLLSANIPNTLYNITSTNNTIYWVRGGALTAQLIEGAYDITGLLTEIADAMTTEDGVQSYTATYDSRTMRITITGTAAFVLNCTTTTNSAWYLLGFETDADTISATTHAADNVIRLDLPAYLLLSIAELYNNKSVSDTNHRATFVIPITTNTQSNELFQTNLRYDTGRDFTAVNSITELTCKLTNPDGVVIDLNGSDFSFLLGLEY